MYLSLATGVYTRIVGDMGYIANMKNGKQLMFDKNGAMWLSVLSHTPRHIDNVVDELIHHYSDVDRAILLEDFESFVYNLHNDDFILISDNCAFENIPNDSKKLVGDIEIPTITDITIELTNRCNERCVHCYLADAKKDSGVFMDFTVVKDLIQQFSLMGGRRVTFTGGEVLLHHDFIEACELATQEKMEVAIFSNLIILNNEFLQRLKDVNVVEIQSSLYSVIAEEHDAITQVKGSCLRTKASIERLVKMGLPVKIACPVMRQNAKSVVNVIKYASQLNIPIELELYINARSNQDDDNLVNRLTIDEMRVFLQGLMEYDPNFCENTLRKNTTVYDEQYNLIDDLAMPLCQAGFYGLYVVSDGTVATCPTMQGFEIGNIYKSTLKEIWESSEKINLIRNIREVNFERCINCEAKEYCVKCLAHNYAEGKDLMHIPTYACEMAFLSKEIIDNYNVSKTIKK